MELWWWEFTKIEQGGDKNLWLYGLPHCTEKGDNIFIKTSQVCGTNFVLAAPVIFFKDHVVRTSQYLLEIREWQQYGCIGPPKFLCMCLPCNPVWQHTYKSKAHYTVNFNLKLWPDNKLSGNCTPAHKKCMCRTLTQQKLWAPSEYHSTGRISQKPILPPPNWPQQSTFEKQLRNHFKRCSAAPLANSTSFIPVVLNQCSLKHPLYGP